MNEQYLSVSALTKYLKAKFDKDPYLERVYLTGEISNFRLRETHQYFSLKDSQTVINATMFQGAFKKLKFQLEEGMKVLVIGRVSLYERSGNYQIIIEELVPDGVGAMYAAMRQLQEKLAQEGLFRADFKQPLVKYPKRIAVLTSPSGAVIRDILTTVKRRYGIAEVVLFPTIVQGKGSAPSIIENLQKADNGNFDTVIVGRGGGSIEDLWSFNEESVVRAIFEAKTPIISSVGHETDTTLADLVADMRAATPSAAAELATPVLTEEIANIQQLEARLVYAFGQHLTQKRLRLKRIQESYVFKQPERLYEGIAQRLDKEKERLLYYSPQKTIEAINDRRKNARNLLVDRIYYTMEKADTHMRKAFGALDLLSPLKVMTRGYSYTTLEEKVVKSLVQIEREDLVKLHFTDGVAIAKIMEKEES